jgi:hypothetical protein
LGSNYYLDLEDLRPFILSSLSCHLSGVWAYCGGCCVLTDHASRSMSGIPRCGKRYAAYHYREKFGRRKNSEKSWEPEGGLVLI